MMSDYDFREHKTNWGDVLRAWVVALVMGVLLFLVVAVLGIAPSV